MATMLTDLVVRQARVPAAGRAELWDSKVGGLLLRITSRGVRSWSVFYRVDGEKRRFTLGDYRADGAVGDGFTIAEARQRARVVLGDVAAGKDPQREKVQKKSAAEAAARREGDTFAQLAGKWLESEAAREWRPKTRAEFTRIVERELVPALGDLAPEDVTKKHVRNLYDRIAARSESMAKHALAIARLLFQWAAEEDYVDAVPVFPRRGTQSNKRTRVLDEVELRAVWTALEAGLGANPRPGKVEAMTEAFRLMLLTAQRRGEVLSMRWDNVTEERGTVWWTIPPERHKGGREHRVPMTAPAIEALKRLHTITGDGEYVFPAPRAAAKLPFIGNPQKAAGRLWATSGVRGATVHDLRRSAATYMVRLAVPRLVVGKVLGHADTDVTGRYDKHAYDQEKRAALTKWADELLRIATATEDAAPAKVLPWR